MQLAAPRQPIFALILVINFLLISALAVFSLHNHEAQVRKNQGTLLLEQINQTLADTVAAKDTVGISLVASRYADLPQINSLKITTKDGKLLSDVGRAPSAKGEVFVGTITKDEQVIGNIDLNLRNTAVGDIIKNQWLWFLGTALLHILLFFIYRLVASQYVVRETVPERAYTGHAKNNPVLKSQEDISFEVDETALASMSATQKGKEDFTTKSSIFPNVGNALEDADMLDMNTRATQGNLNKTNTNLEITSEPTLTTTINQMRLHIRFEDPNNFLDKVSSTKYEPYLKLCDKLLDNAIVTLLESDIIPKSVGFDKVEFSQDGVNVIAISENKNNAAYACFLLAQLYLLIHEVTYQKHREIQYFALQGKACIANQRSIQSLTEELARTGTENDIFVLLTTQENKLYKGQVQLLSHENPTSVLQRDIGVVDAVNHELMQQISLLRDHVLLK